MTESKRPVAFVAMKFESDHWNDKRYIVMREELEHAGFLCVRGDQIETSGPVVDEVSRMLREADLVVIDSSGNSHNVSYEIGFFHGAARSAETTILLRSDAELPFNYRHYRFRIYRDLRHLRRILRDYLKIHEPLSEDQYGYTFTFSFLPSMTFGYIEDGAFCLFDALRQLQFSGRCECFSGEQFGIPGRFFSVGLMLRQAGRKPTPEYEWWMKIVESALNLIGQAKNPITLETDMSELARKRAMKEILVPCGTAEFSNGQLTRILGQNDEACFFASYQKRQTTIDME